jgi:hypothetical protein
MAKTIELTHHAIVELAIIRFFQMLNSHCPGNLAPLMTPDVELLADESAAGQETVNAFFMHLWEAYPCMSFVVQNVITNDTGAAAEVTYENGPKGKGARCLVFQFKGDKIRRVRFY